ncbi:MAG: arginine--tRNA ligase, partial [Planctomycetota bacterium]
IYRKGADQIGQLADGKISLTEPAERLLGRQILRFAETIDSVCQGSRINLLTDYLYELAGAFMKFYESCPVLKADTDDQRASRLKLCDLAARTLRIGLNLLGIRTVERM